MSLRRSWLALTLAVLGGCASSPPAKRVPRPGLLVEKVDAEGVAAKAGVQVGDVLLSWRRGLHGGGLISPIDLDQVRVEEAPRGGAKLAGTRDGSAVSFDLGEGEWGLESRPRLANEMDGELARARRMVGAKASERLHALATTEGRAAVRAWLLVLAAEAAGVDAGGRLWPQAVVAAGDDAPTRAWVHERHGRALQAVSHLEEAAAAYERALASRPPGSLAAAASLSYLGLVARSRGDLEAAERSINQALEIRERLTPGSLLVAASLNHLGNVASSRGDWPAAEEDYLRALEIGQRLAPDSLNLATTLNNLGGVALHREQLEDAERCYRRSLEIKQGLAPGSLAVAASLSNLGAVAGVRGDLEAAESFHRVALETRERLAPGSLDVAQSLHNLGVMAWTRGDLEAAESYYLRALDVRERLAPGSLDVAQSLNNLGVVVLERGDLDGAERYHRRALEIQERLSPGGLDLARSLNNLGSVGKARGELEAAEGHFRRALEIQELLAPESLQVASSLNNLGVVAEDHGDLEAAERYYRAGLEIRRRLAPGGLDEAVSLINLGGAARARGDLAMAEEYVRQSLEIRELLAPGSQAEAGALYSLALVLRAMGRRRDALDTLQRAERALEAQQLHLGGTAEQLVAFRAMYLPIYRDLIDLLLDEDQPEEAFGILERARARALLAMLAERDIVARDMPPELERERRIANADHDRTMAALGRLTAADEGERVRLLAALDAIRQHQEEIRGLVRSASPRLADLRYPEPLDLGATSQVLGEGTLLLEPSLSAEASRLFLVGPGLGRFAVYPAGIGEDEVRSGVEQLRRLVERGRFTPEGGGSAAGGEALTRAARSLSEILLLPASAELEGCARLILVPDGALHLLPFAALLDPTAGYDRYLVEARPISVVASATVLAQLQKQRKPPREARLTAFGDPIYPTAAASGERRAASSGLSLEPLPATRVEVESLAGLFGERATVWLGAEATEERAKTIGQEATVVHFAAHGLVDERRPLSSALALTMPEQAIEGQDNGILQAWEVFEQVRLDADLVVLSACETALGKEVAGEGILGLTRAFQYAGARSVLASLWSVADESTAELMRRFYANLEAGMAKDEALRQAQLAFIRGGVAVGEREPARDLSHPFYWAAFQIYGDWR